MTSGIRKALRTWAAILSQTRSEANHTTAHEPITQAE